MTAGVDVVKDEEDEEESDRGETDGGKWKWQGTDRYVGEEE